ncbi:MAG TPA: ribosome silencing factor [Chloroflexota bacterium]|nr:ribosome silencing factor [Chloroflexota bacterium]
MQQTRAAPTRDLDPSALAHRIVDVASDRKAIDVHLLDIRRLTTFADYFVVMSGTSTIHIRALANNIEESLDGDGVHPLHIEGSADDGWILLDYAQVVVHIFSAQQREFYALERLWGEGTTIVRIQ